MNGAPAKTRGESATYFVDPRLPGLEFFQATFVTHNFARHVHECYAIGVIEQGALRFDYLGREHVAPAGSVNLVVPGEAHNGDAGHGDGWSYRMLYLAPDVVQRAVRQCGYKGDLPHFPKGVLQDPELAAGVLALHQGAQTGKAPGLALDHALLRLLARWVRRHAERPARPIKAGSEPVAVHRALEFMRARFAEDIRLEELAAVTGLSPFYLARMFSKSVGVPPGRYLVQLRVQAAKAMMQGQDPLCEVAVNCGFADQSHMTREFKRILGVPPGGYRKMIQDR